jgi:hypothetical protein
MLYGQYNSNVRLFITVVKSAISAEIRDVRIAAFIVYRKVSFFLSGMKQQTYYLAVPVMHQYYYGLGICKGTAPEIVSQGYARSSRKAQMFDCFRELCFCKCER